MAPDDTEAFLADALTAAGRSILVVTGAGISLASGIPTFRGTDPGAVWATSVMEKATHAYFERDPAGSWQFYLARWQGLVGKLPNPAHAALVDLERWQQARAGELVLVTQNIDCLHEAAGTKNLIKAHGSSDRLRCSAEGCAHGAPAGTLLRADVDVTAFLANPADSTVPRCPACRALLRQHVLWFDESYDEHRDYRIDDILGAAKRAQLVLFVGTSFSVGLTELILERALAHGAQLVSIDPTPRASHPRVVALAAQAEALLPAVVARLG